MAAKRSSCQASKRSRRYLKDRRQPTALFQIFRNHRVGYLLELKTIYKGQVYVTSCDGLKPGVYKIGKSTDHFSKRSQALSQPTGVPGRYYPVYRMETDYFDQIEKDILKELHLCRLHERKEFVECELENIVSRLRASHRRLVPGKAFAEYFYYPIEEYEQALKEIYQSFLFQPQPQNWPRICIFLSLISGLTPVEVLSKSLQFDVAALKPRMNRINLAASDIVWLSNYLASLMRHGYIPFGEELLREGIFSSSLWSELEDADIERYQWFTDWLEELLWDAIGAEPFLIKAIQSINSDSVEDFCATVFAKASQYWGEAPGSLYQQGLGLIGLTPDFYFI